MSSTELPDAAGDYHWHGVNLSSTGQLQTSQLRMLSLLVAFITSSASMFSAPCLTVKLSGELQVTDADWATNIFNVKGEDSYGRFKGVKVCSAFRSNMSF